MLGVHSPAKTSGVCVQVLRTAALVAKLKARDERGCNTPSMMSALSGSRRRAVGLPNKPLLSILFTVTKVRKEDQMKIKLRQLAWVHQITLGLYQPQNAGPQMVVSYFQCLTLYRI